MSVLTDHKYYSIILTASYQTNAALCYGLMIFQKKDGFKKLFFCAIPVPLFERVSKSGTRLERMKVEDSTR
jgi:hypothetical protein